MKVKRQTTRVVLLAALVTMLVAGVAAAPTAAAPGTPDTLYVPPPDHGAKRQIAELTSQRRQARRRTDPIDDRHTAGRVVHEGHADSVQERRPRRPSPGPRPAVGPGARGLQHPVPRLRAVLGRRGDVARPSTRRGSTDSRPASATATAIVILEPDGLGIIPWYDPYGGADGSNALEWCQPAEADPGHGGVRSVRHAAPRRRCPRRAPKVTTYLDGTHSAWLGVGRHRPATRAGRGGGRRRLLPQRLQLPVHRQQRAVRRLDLGMPRLRHRA